METTIKVGRRGVVTLPREVREKAGLKEGDTLLVRLEPDGGIHLQQAAVLRVREYGEEELAAFREEDAMPSGLRTKLDDFLGR